MKPTILVLASTFPKNSRDKGPRFIADLCLSLSKRYQVTVLTQHRPGALITENYEGVQVIRYRYAPERFQILSENGGINNALKYNLFAWLLIPCLIISQILAIRSVIKTAKPSVIHAHWLIPQAFCAVLAQTRSSARIPLVTTSHGGDLYGLKGRSMNRLKCWIIGSCDTFCVVSSAMRKFVYDNLYITHQDIHICPMGADLESKFVPGPSVIRKPGQILFVGRLVEKKGVKYLLHALKQLIEKKPDTHLVIAGTGPELIQLQLLTQSLYLTEFVSFRGGMDHKSLANLYQESEVCVFPFVQSTDGDMEGLGLVVIEAMGCKCPVIVGDVPAVKDIVIDGQTGLICDPKREIEIMSQVLDIRSNLEKRSVLVNSAYKHVIENYSWEVCADRYSKIFDNLIDTHS